MGDGTAPEAPSPKAVTCPRAVTSPGADPSRGVDPSPGADPSPITTPARPLLVGIVTLCDSHHDARITSDDPLNVIYHPLFQNSLCSKAACLLSNIDPTLRTVVHTLMHISNIANLSQILSQFSISSISAIQQCKMPSIVDHILFPPRHNLTPIWGTLSRVEGGLRLRVLKIVLPKSQVWREKQVHSTDRMQKADPKPGHKIRNRGSGTVNSAP